MPTPLQAVAQAVEAEAMKPSPQERAELAEIQRRISEVDSGAVVCWPWHEVMADLKTVAER